MPINEKLPRKNQMIYSRNLREHLQDVNLEALTDAEMWDVYSKIWTEEHTSDKLTFLRFKDDTSGGPYMPGIYFKHKDFEGEFLILNSYMGASFILNPGPRNVSGHASDFNLDERDMAYVWDCFDTYQKRECNFWHT